VLVTDWTTISSLATGAGTLVLAIATFASVRSANRAARVAEQALHVNLRPLVMPSRLNDPPQKIFFQEGKYFVLEGGRGAAEVENGVVYLAISLRGAGQGLAVLHGWRFLAGRESNPQRPPLELFRPQGLDILITPGEVGFWEAAFRDSNDPQYDEAVAAVKDGELLSVDLLYGDNDGGQRVISRIMLRRIGPDSPWLATVVRHWNLDRPDPRDRPNLDRPDPRDRPS
jgi:hypothetical protein